MPRATAPGMQSDPRYEQDPITGEQVDVQVASHVEYLGRLYYFASTENRDAFLDNPERYLTEREREEATRPAP